MRRTTKFFLGLVLAFRAASMAFAQQGPDLTTNLTPGDCAFDFSYSYNLGPTGLRGWIYIQGGGGTSHGITETMTAGQPYQVLVTAIGTNTPAYGVFQTNDVLLGVNTGSNNVPVPLFTNDTRRAIGAAIGAAEAGDGWMNFKRWRAGVTNDVSIQLGLRGLAYSATAPYNCPKSAVILSNAVNVLASRPLNYGSIGNQIVGLAMLASGNTNFAPTLQSYAQSIRAPNPGDWFWDIGYSGVFLSEYYWKTGDTSILPRLASLALYCANGQDRYGTMCHGPGFNNADGSPNGTAGGYGPVNAVGVTANLAMVMAQKCLVAAGQAVDPAIPAAITRGTNFFGWYVQKGEIQYGEHLPWGAGGHAANGKHGGAALLFAMTGNRPVETEYWMRMTLAGYMGREYGHTGQGLSYLWDSLGANLGGTNAMAAYMQQIQWHLDLERRSDGSFVYDGHEQYGPSQTSDYWTSINYADEDPTAYYVLTYALPLQQIYLTGKNANPTNVLSADKLTNAIWAAMIPTNSTQMTTNQLVAALSEYDPNVRYWSALELGRRPGVDVGSITNLVNSTNAWTRGAACVVLGQMRDPNGFASLVQSLSDSDISVRAHAATALKKCGAAITNFIPAMLIAYTNNVTDPTVINWKDPWQGANEVLGSVLWGGWLLTNGQGNDDLVPYTANASRTLLFPALRAALKHPDSLSRGDAATFINQRLSVADIQALVLDLIQCATTPVMADPMWRSDGRANSIRALAKYNGAEAVPVAMAMLNPPWIALGQGDGPDSESPNAALNAVATYGDSVRYLLPTLNNYVSAWGASDGRFSTVVSAVNTISVATNSPAITNLFPVANHKVVATTNAVAVALTGFSCRTNAVTFQNVTAPSHGILTGTAPNLTYTPNPGYTGLDKFTFQVADSLTNSDPATVSIIVSKAGAGVPGQYYDNADFTNLKFTRVDPQINFDWGTGSPTNTMAADTFSVRWSGRLLVPETGNYLFSTLASDGVRLFINGVLVLNDWVTQDRHWTDGATVNLVAGQQYDVALDYFENTGNAMARLKWTGPSFAGSNGVVIGSQWLSDSTGLTNLPVYAYAQNVTMLQNTNQAITLAGSTTATSYQIVTGPANGSLTGSTPTVTYTPNANYTGADSFTFTVSDGVSTSAPAAVSISILSGDPVTFDWKTAVAGGWSVGGNWTNNASPAATGQPFYTLNFNPSGTYTVTNDLNTGFAVNQINFAATVTMAGNQISATNNGPLAPQINQNSANGITINAPLDLSATTTLGGTGSGQITVNSLISGKGGWIKNFFGKIQINNITNTYTGGTVINAGTVSGPGGNGNVSLFLGTGPVTINAGGTLFVDRNYFTNSIAWNGGTVTGGNSFESVFGGPVTLSGVAVIDMGTTGGFDISGNVSGPGGLRSVGTHPWTLSGTNSYTGPTFIDAGTISYSKSVSVAPGRLNINNGAIANLNYSGTRTINWLTLGGADKPAGVYGSLTSPAANQDSHFTGNGTVTLVPVVGVITNQPASAVTTNAATLNAALTGNGAPYAVVAYWNTTNAGTNAVAWTNSVAVGSWAIAGTTNISCVVTGLSANTQYFFTFRATNAIQSLWATNVQFFVTATPTANAYLANLVSSLGTLTPAFDVFTTNYTATVLYSNSSLTVTPTAADSNATIKVNGNVVPSGTASSAISLSVGSNTINTVVVSQNLAATNTYTLTAIRSAASTNVALSNLVSTAGALSPVFASGTFSYSATVPYVTTSVTVTPTLADLTATVTVNGSAVPTGTASGAIALNIGANIITNLVTAEDGVTTQAYLLTVTRIPASVNANLANLVPSAGTLSPAFASNIFNYATSLLFATSNLTVTATTADLTATMTVNGNPVSSGTPSGTINLSVGTNTITTVVTAQNGVTIQTYTLAVTRAPASTNAALANLLPSAGALDPAFASGTFSYTNNVSFGTGSMAVTPTAADTTATIKVNGQTVNSGSSSASTNLIVGPTAINTVVVSEDQSVTNTYIVTAIRAASITRWWDGGSTNIPGNGDGSSAGGSGLWNTSTQNWDQGSGTPRGPWDNAVGNIAFFGGTAGTVTNQGVTVGGLIFTSAYTILSNTVTFATAGSLSNSAAVTIASGVTGNGPITKDGAGALTLSGTNNLNGLTISAAAGAVTISSNTFLGSSQTWSNASANTLTVNGSVTNNGNLLTFDGNANTIFGNAAAIISGSGSIIKNGSGLLRLGANPAPAHTYTGTTTINGGIVMIYGSKSAGNFTLNGGLLTDYTGSTFVFTNGLGAGNQQILVFGDSGFGGGNGVSTWRIGTAGSILQWGSANFNPTQLRILAPGVDNMGPTAFGAVALDNGLDLNGSSRTVSVAAATGPLALASSYGKINGNSTNTTGSAGLVKIGGGNLLLAGNNSYNGGTTIDVGALRFDSINAMPGTGNVQVNDGAILGIKLGGAGNWTNLTSGVGSLGGLLAGQGGRGSSTVGYSGNVGLLLDVAANTTYSNAIANVGTSLALYKMGANSLTLSGNNTYSAGTILFAGTLNINSPTALGSGTITINGGAIDNTTGGELTLSNPQIWNGDFTFTGTTNLNLGTGAVTLGSTRIVTVGAKTLTVGGAIGGAGFGLTKAGTGTLVLTGTNTYSGATTVNAGTLVVNAGRITNNAAVNVTGGNNSTMIITNGGQVFSGAASNIGNGTSTNTLLVVGGSGVTSLWNLGNQDLFLNNGSSQRNNRLVIDGAGYGGSAVVTNVNILVLGRTSIDSSVLLTNGGRMFVNGEVRLGNPYYGGVGATFDSLTIVGGTADSIFYGKSGSSFYVGYGERAGSANNQVYVGAGGVLTNIGDFYLGQQNNAQNGPSPAFSNQLVVADGGKAFFLSNLSVGFANFYAANSNTVLIANGSLVNIPGTLNIGNASAASTTSSYNRVAITAGGILTNVSVTIGTGAGYTINNYLTVDGGSVLAKTVTVTRASNWIALNAGTLNVASSTVYSNGTDFVVGDGAQAATLLLNGGTHRFQTALVVANGSTLGGTGTVNGTTIVMDGGILAPGNSAGTLRFASGSLILSNTAALNFELGTISDSVVCTNLVLDGVLNVTNAGGFGPGTNTLFTYTGTLTDNGLIVNNPLPGGNTGTIDTTIAGQVRLIVTTAATPPVVSFTGTPVSGLAPLQVVFTDTSTGTRTSWAWDFDNNGTTDSTAQNPTNTYSPGTYSVRLIVCNGSACSTNTVNNYITAFTAQQSWESAYGVLANGTDTDGDGESSLDEFLAGFNPTNSAASLRILNIARTGNDIIITFLGSNGDTNYPGGPSSRTNVLEYTSGLGNGSFTNDFVSTGQTNVLSGGTGTGVVTSFTETNGATFTPSRYYRVRVLVP